MLKQTFIHLLANYTTNTPLINHLWAEIESNYANKNRHYHTLLHLHNLLQQLLEIKHKIENWETILFTLYYHDIIYNTLKSDNEAQSAQLAEKRMQQINVPNEIIANCKAQILATQTHLQSCSSDTNYFTDADLSVLGQDLETYTAYYQNIRKEYAMYPNLLYNTGRKKVLKHFLAMESIYKTTHFYNKFEKKAIQNLKHELAIIEKN